MAQVGACHMYRYYTICLYIMLLAVMTACRNRDQSSAPALAPLTETISSGPIDLTIIAEPAQVHLDRDILLTLRVCAPSNIEVRLPPLENRLKGFVLNGAFTRDAQNSGKKPVKEYCFRLTPTLADEYRIAPMAITWINCEQTPPSGGWFASRPIIFQPVAVSKTPTGATINDITAPAWIYPPFKTVALWMFFIICAAGVIYLLWWLSRRIHKAIQLRRMSPRERALYELNELLAQDLIGKEKIKEFYLELTMIVRRYIERAHAIRAPEQTTEEFLIAATRNPEFSREVVLKLRVFLQTADLVKFAAYHPDREIIDQTLATARDYIDTDEQSQPKLKEA
ncbi:MAG: hypothetical protein Q7J98_04745 [Kiritimatiellia bacterium]|nr:hypothetical protein [Kiritimatiellia bacterium]